MTLRWWPRSLFGRILLVMALGLALAHALTFVLAFTERSMTMRRAMVSYFASDVASSVAMLERLPATERAQWVVHLNPLALFLELMRAPLMGSVSSPSSWGAAVAVILLLALIFFWQYVAIRRRIVYWL